MSNKSTDIEIVNKNQKVIIIINKEEEEAFIKNPRKKERLEGEPIYAWFAQLSVICSTSH